MVSNQAEFVVVAELVCLEEPPGLWSGVIPSVQRVHYRPISILKGSITESRLDVGHFVVKNSATADREKPRLRSALFKAHTQLILFLVNDSGKGYFTVSERTSDDSPKSKLLLTVDANYGAIPASEANLKGVTRIVSQN
jgi:hypothetical protein